MTVRRKLVFIVVLVALVPLVIASTTALELHRRAYLEKVEELQKTSAALGVLAAQMRLDEATRGLDLLAARTIRWGDLDEKERQGAVLLVYRQIEEIAVASLIDEKGDGLATYYQQAYVEGDPHPRIDVAGLEVFADRIPFDEALSDGMAVGDAFLARRDASPLLPVAVRVPGASESRPWVVAVALSLDGLCSDVARASSSGAETFLLDEADRVLCGPRESWLQPLAVPALPSGVFRIGEGEKEVIAAIEPLVNGWRLVVQQPVSEAFAASRRIGMQSALWVLASLGIAVAAGLLLSAGLQRSIASLGAAARHIAEGSFGHRLPEESADEFGEVARAFNEMGVQIEKRDAEIRAWNEELQARVDARTRELREAQQQLVESHKVAAMSALGAGMAHEINNPLAGLLGLSQILREQSERRGDTNAAEMLRRVEGEAERIRGIVRRLTSLADSAQAQGFSPTDVNALLVEVLDAFRAEARPDDPPLKIETRFESGLPPVLGRGGELREVFIEILRNARTATKAKGGGHVVVTTSTVEGQLVRILFEDDGKGIPPENLDKVFEPFFTTKDEWSSKGLGLSIAYKLVQAHNGTIRVANRPEAGAAVSVVIPIARKGAALV